MKYFLCVLKSTRGFFCKLQYIVHLYVYYLTFLTEICIIFPYMFNEFLY